MDRQLLRHMLATLAYRATRVLEDSTVEFGSFDACGRTPLTILAHMGDLLEWALSAVQGKERWNPLPPQTWPQEQQRFYGALANLDTFLASETGLQASAERLLQGPVADALTHVGQLAMMRRMAGSPARGENFYVAEVAVGRVGAQQAAPVRQF